MSLWDQEELNKYNNETIEQMKSKIKGLEKNLAGKEIKCPVKVGNYKSKFPFEDDCLEKEEQK